MVFLSWCTVEIIFLMRTTNHRTVNASKTEEILYTGCCVNYRCKLKGSFCTLVLYNFHRRRPLSMRASPKKQTPETIVMVKNIYTIASSYQRTLTLATCPLIGITVLSPMSSRAPRPLQFIIKSYPSLISSSKL